MKIKISQLRRIIREEVQKNLGEGYATLGLAQKIAGEYPEKEIRKFLTSPEPKGFGFMPDEIGDDLEGFLARLSMKDLNTLEKHFGEKYGMWQSSTKMGEAKGPKVPQTRKPKLGDIYKNKAGHQISVEFLDGNSAGWELLARGKPKSLDGTTEELQAALTAGGFQFDRKENVY